MNSSVQGESSDRTSAFSHNFNNQFKVLYYNGRSLLPKLSYLFAECNVHRPALVCITESWLDLNICDFEMSIPGCNIIRRDRNRHGGGVCVYVNCNYSYRVISCGPLDTECIFVSISSNLHHKSNLSVCVFYRPPSSGSLVLVFLDYYFKY